MPLALKKKILMSSKYKEQTAQICEFFFLQGHSTVLHKDNYTIWILVCPFLGVDYLAEKLAKNSAMQK